MNESIHLGRIGRTRIGLNWTLIPVAFFITWGLADGLPHEVAGYPAGAYWLAGALTALAFYASLLAHELAHAVVARRQGQSVRGIVLWLFGGLAQIEGDSPDAGSEFRLAAIGPLTSFVVAGLAAAGAWVLSWLGVVPLAAAALGWLAGINLLLGGFNLLPAFPLDGGRVLRAILWRRSGDRDRATLGAARTGRVLGFVLVAFGLYETLFAGNFSGLWLALVGWFISGSATQQMLVSRAQPTGPISGSSSQGSPFGRPAAGPGFARPTTANPAFGPGPGAVVDLRGGPSGAAAAVVTVPSTLTVSETYDRYFKYSQLTSVPVVDEDGRLVGTVSLEGLYAVPGERWWLTSVLEATRPLTWSAPQA
jgi:Zn-dependent protease